MAVPAGWDEYARLTDRIHALQKIRENLDQQIAYFERQRERLQRCREAPVQPVSGPPLKGLKLAVVGPSFREATYKELLEPLGAVVLFAPSENKLGKVDRICSKAHGILYITSFAGHDTDDHVNAAAERRGIPLVRISATGLKRLREAALTLREDMIVFKELQG